MPYNIQVHIQHNRIVGEKKVKAYPENVHICSQGSQSPTPERDFVPTFQYRSLCLRLRTRAHARRGVALKHVRIVCHASGDVLVHHTHTSLHLHVYVRAVLEDSALPGRGEHEGRRVVHVRVHGREFRIRTAARGVRSLMLLLVLVLLLRSVRIPVRVRVCMCIREVLRVDQDRLRVLLLVLGLKFPIVLLANNLSVVVLMVVVLSMGMLTGIRIDIKNCTSASMSIPTDPTKHMTTVIALTIRRRGG